MNLPELTNKIRYDTKVVGTTVVVTAYLPEGFTMSTYTRMFDMRHAPDLDMTDQEYAIWQQNQLLGDLILRIRNKELRMQALKELEDGTETA